MSAMSRTAVAVLFFALLFTLACGGGGSNAVAAPPVFSLTTPGGASEGTLFTYTVQATDPQGGTVSYALASAPAGATISGATINWTPTHAQSRQPNDFTVKATTRSGGTATASFTVTPAGTIQGTYVTTNWTSAGATDQPMDLSRLRGLQALVPDGNGGYNAYAAQGGVGTFSIPNVPAGYYWLQVGAQLCWTNSSDVDLGRDTSVGTAGPGGSEQITANVNLDGLDPWKAGFSTTGRDGLQGIIPSRGTGHTVGEQINFLGPIGIPDGATTFSGQMPVMAFTSDPSKGDLTYLLQTETLTGTTGSVPWTQYRVVEATGSLPLFIDSTTTALDITATFSAQNPSSIDMEARSAGFNSSVVTSNPSSSSLAASGFHAGVYSVFSGRNTTVDASGIYTFVSGDFTNSLPLLSPVMLSLTVPGIPLASLTFNTQLESDLSAGNISFTDPFTSFDKNVYAAEQDTAVATFQSATGTAYQFAATGYSSTSAPTESKPFDPPLLNVQNPKINGLDLFHSSSVTSPITLSWDAPQLGTPNGYLITMAGFDPSGASCPQPPSGGISSVFCVTGIYHFTTPTTSVTIPPNLVTAGISYVFTIRAVSDNGTDFLKAPNRGSWNRAYSDVLSGPIAIGTSSPVSAQIRRGAVQTTAPKSTNVVTVFQEIDGKLQQVCVAENKTSAGPCKK